MPRTDELERNRRLIQRYMINQCNGVKKVEDGKSTCNGMSLVKKKSELEEGKDTNVALRPSPTASETPNSKPNLTYYYHNT
jgi:hypothetical protein